nr:Chain A, Myc proto-oncogene protein [Homo sapiens]
LLPTPPLSPSRRSG